jgi:hypothetical protein
MIDARHAPRHIQEEAYRRRLIPYLPIQGETTLHPTDATTLPFKLSETVVVKSGVYDPNFGDDTSG